MTIPIVTDLTEPPVIGRFYLVPCIYYWHFDRLAWWPVIGPKHDDVEHLQFAPPHYHVDRRFLPLAHFTRRDFGRVKRKDVTQGVRPWRDGDTSLAATPISQFERYRQFGRDKGGPLPATVLRRKRCTIADVGFPAVEVGGDKFRRFHAAYEGKRCGRDADGHLICPHKGARLSSLAADRNGVVTCPLHGLAVNVVSGVVVKRARAGGSVTR